MLAPGTESEEQIVWKELLPAAPEGQWLEFDEFAKMLTITPAAAQPRT